MSTLCLIDLGALGRELAALARHDHADAVARKRSAIQSRNHYHTARACRIDRAGERMEADAAELRDLSRDGGQP